MKQDRSLLRGSRLPLILAFAVPFFLFLATLCCGGLGIFGNKQAINSDGWHQYFPFLVEFRDTIRSGGSLEYTWSVGMGIGYSSLYAYYLASPLNWLSVIMPLSALNEFYSVIIVVKVAAASLFFTIFLKMVYRRNDMSLPVFSLMYAFCAFAAGYYWNLMWLDAFAMLPLLIAGMVCLLRNGRFRLYTAALAITLLVNYYTAFFCCIFVLLTFFIYAIVCWKGWKNFFKRFVRIGVCTLIAVLIAAVLIVPTLKGMETTYSSTGKDVNLLALNMVDGAKGEIPEGGTKLDVIKNETLPGLLSGLRQVLGNLLPGNSPTKMSGLPNVFCTFAAVVLAIYYCCCRKIRLREKLLNVGLLLFFILSFCMRILDYIWHGFHFPNMLPYRFSFLFSFVVIAMAYRAWILADGFKLWHLAVLLPIVGLLIVNAWFLDLAWYILAAAGLSLAVTVVVLVLSGRGRRTAALLVLSVLVLAEAMSSIIYGVCIVDLSSQENYPKDGDGVQELLALAEAREAEAGNLFWRTEATATQTLNDGAINGYNGATIFSSSANVNFTRFSRSLGLSSWPGSNRTAYYESSPFTNLMCSIKYILDREKDYSNPGYHTIVGESDSTYLLENEAYVAMGFMTDIALADFVAEENKYNPIWEQERMFPAATGVEENLYNHMDEHELIAPEGYRLWGSGTSGTQYSYTGPETGKATYEINFKVTTPGLYIATTKVTGCETVNIYEGDTFLFSRNIKARSLFVLGTFEEGDIISLHYTLEDRPSGTISVDVALQNNEVFDAGYAALADEPWVLTEVSDTRLAGTIEVLEDGLFYTSIPYEPGWRAWVDGQEVSLAETYDPQNEAVKLTDAVISFPLTAGHHEIVLEYSAPGRTTGILLGITGLALFALLLVLKRRNPVLLPDEGDETALPEPEAETPEQELPEEVQQPMDAREFLEMDTIFAAWDEQAAASAEVLLPTDEVFPMEMATVTEPTEPLPELHLPEDL